jgi:uncharacterized protein YaaN involved in tellurite resistance
MVTREHHQDQKENTGLVQVNNQQIAPVGVQESKPPKGVSEDERQELEARAIEVVRHLEDAGGARELELVDQISGLGIQAQRGASTELQLLRGRVGDILTRDGPGAQVSKDLVDLRLALNQIDARDVGQVGFTRWMVGKLPFVRDPALKLLEKIAVRFEPVYRQGVVIESRLRDGRAMLVRDNVELRKLYEQVESQQLPIQKNAYFGGLVMEQLSQLLERTDDPTRRERIRNLLHDVSMRVQDLRTMEEVHGQFFVSIEITRQNNNRLGQSVERTLALGTNVVMVGLAIQSALARQRRVLEANRKTREFLGNLIVANAAAIKQHTEEIGDIYNDPVIAIEKITQAHNDLIETMNTADRLRLEGIVAARENIAKLAKMSAELEERSRGLLPQAEAGPGSLEA